MKKFRFAIQSISFALIFFILFGLLGGILQNKTCAEEYSPFFREDVDDYDVLIIGSSVARGGISPLDLWHNYGIVSYNLAMSGQPLGLNYYSLKSAFKFRRPKVVVVDVTYIFLQNQNGAEERQHQLIDNMPWQYGKLDAIISLIEPEKWNDYFFKLLFYHTRWKELTAKDFAQVESLNKGCTLSSFTRDADGNLLDAREYFGEPLQIIPKTEKMEIPAAVLESIEKIIDLCKKEGVEIVFVAFPCYAWGEVNHGDGAELQKMWNQFYDVSEEYGVEYINYMHEFDKINFDPGNDLTDWRHLSYTGAEKVTNDLGDFLVSEYGLSDRHGDPKLSNWDIQWEELENNKERLENQRTQEREKAQ